MLFKLNSDYKPAGDQPQAISQLTKYVQQGAPAVTLLGVTGSGKTFTIANLIEKLQRPTLVISHNKTLAAQLYGEFKEFFPENAVRYFVSYYDYYQPEAYLPGPDTFIEKDASVNEELDRLRLEATHALLERRDTIVVSSVSCIYGIGSPDNYKNMYLHLTIGQTLNREEFLHKLVEMQYMRGDIDFFRGRFRVKGDIIEIFPAYSQNAFRLDFFDNVLEKISEIDPLTGNLKKIIKEFRLYPARHYILPYEQVENAVTSIRTELDTWHQELEQKGKLLEAERVKRRTEFDIEMLKELGYCQGIENYSRHLEGRQAGQPAFTLLDYFPEDKLVIVDESHVTVSQVRGMHNGDRSRKESLVSFGFRLPSAFDNRPLYFEEFEERVPQMLFLSATPGEYELRRSEERVVEQIIRPTGLTDPVLRLEPVAKQVDHLLGEIKQRITKEERVLVTTLTKRMAEDLTEYLTQLDIKVSYLHSDIDTLERVKIIRSLRLGEIDVLVGVNLLREGLDLPEVSLVAILDADKEGFLRSTTSLIQTIGRAARNVAGEVILYADNMTKSLKQAINETNRRREKQLAYNLKEKITPQSIKKNINDSLYSICEKDYFTIPVAREDSSEYLTPEKILEKIVVLEEQMKQAAKELNFEQAAELRDEINKLRETKPNKIITAKLKKFRRKRGNTVGKVSNKTVKRVYRRMKK